MDRRGLPGELQRAHCEPDRMAGKGRGLVAAGGRRNRPGIARVGAQCRAHFELGGRTEVPDAPRGIIARCLKFLLFALALIAASAPFAAERVLASRVWPAQEYTRVTLESTRPLAHQFFLVTSPGRLVVDLEGVELDSELKALPGKVGDNDPSIQAVRVAVNRPNVVRIVFDLRTEVKPSVFPLPPAGEYKHRLVLDIYPARPVDPLLALLAPKTDPIAEIGEAPVGAAALVPPLPVGNLQPAKPPQTNAPPPPKPPPAQAPPQ